MPADLSAYRPAFRGREFTVLQTAQDAPICEHCGAIVFENRTAEFAPFCSSECQRAAAEGDDDDGCPMGDPECLSNNGECHDACVRPIPEGKRATRTSAESQWYIDTGELPDADAFTEHTFVCTVCKRTARALAIAIAMMRRYEDCEGRTDAELAASLDFCLGCLGDPREGEHVAQCFGSEDEKGNAICEGTDAKVVSFAVPGGGTAMLTMWCADCRTNATSNGYTIFQQW